MAPKRPGRLFMADALVVAADDHHYFDDVQQPPRSGAAAQPNAPPSYSLTLMVSMLLLKISKTDDWV